MAFDSIAEMMHMAGHGIFVWPVYGIFLLIIAGLVYLPVRRYRQALALVRKYNGEQIEGRGAAAGEQ